MDAAKHTPLFSIIVPVRDGAATLAICFDAIAHSTFSDYELIVVDDGSADTSPQIAQHYTANLLQAGGIGPAGARNLAAQQAQGAYLCFLDADCALHPHTLAQTAARLQAEPTIDALIGSYERHTPIPTFAAQYKNLQHHFTHQQNAGRIPTFWTGYGVMRRTLFQSLGGFDADKFQRPAIEDIELGYRATLAGATLILDPTLLITHHKVWTLKTLISAEIFARALPWSRLLAGSDNLPNTLNISAGQRLSALLALLLPLTIFRRVRFMALPLLLLLGLLNYQLYALFWRTNGGWFAARAFAFHCFYFIYSAIVFAFATIEHWVQSHVAVVK